MSLNVYTGTRLKKVFRRSKRSFYGSWTTKVRRASHEARNCSEDRAFDFVRRIHVVSVSALFDQKPATMELRPRISRACRALPNGYGMPSHRSCRCPGEH